MMMLMMKYLARVQIFIYNRAMDQMQYEKSKDNRSGMFDDYDREKNIERKSFRCEQKKMRSKVDLLFIMFLYVLYRH